MLGQPFMPWQRYVADVGCEIDPDTGLPAYNEIFVTVPRQSGKTTLFLSWQIDRCLNWGKLQRSVFTAQTGKDARDKWLDELIPLIEGSKLKALVPKNGINRGMGNEAIKWRNGSLIRILSTSAASGHSKTVDQAVMDEIWHDVDDRREQGLRPAMITRQDRQLLICSTAGTAASTVYNRKVEAGRRAAQEDVGRGIAYFEWSAPDDWDPEDQGSWWEFMPALGYTITPQSIEQERLSMEAGEFKRAYGNRPTAGVDVLIPLEVWQRVNQPDAKAEGKVRFGLDVAEDRASASIAVAGANGVVELWKHEPGTDWIVDECNRLTKEHRTTVAFDKGGPAGAYADSLKAGEPMTGQAVLHACGAMYDAIVDAKVTFRQDGSFDAAMNGAVKKPVGDLWCWSRKASMADVTPLMAATLAFRGKAPAAKPYVFTT
jgi:phage terminase large subunit-like protein